MPALFWATAKVGSEAIPSLGEWKTLVANVMREQGVQNVSVNPTDINGFTPGTFVAVTFIQLDNLPTFVAVIMVAGDTAEPARDLSLKLQNAIEHITVL